MLTMSAGWFGVAVRGLKECSEHRSERGNYLRTCRVMRGIDKCLIGVFLLFCINTRTSLGNIMGDQCDWAGNGLSATSSQGRGVTPVYLRCSQGHVTWSYPRGALRVVLRLPSADKEFKGCIKVSPDFGGARLFLEGQRLLVPLFSLNDGGHKQLVRCFHSIKGQAAIYVEATDHAGSFRKEVAAFSYDLHPIPRGSTVMDLINDECRPCTREEMARAFCTSDLVTRGTIHSIDDVHELELAQVNVRVTKFLRHSTDDNLLSNDVEDSSARSPKKLKKHKNSEEEMVGMNMPRHCAPQHGPGEFVFMGRRRLGDLTLVCVPHLAEWVDIVHTMNADGTSHCVLKS